MSDKLLNLVSIYQIRQFDFDYAWFVCCQSFPNWTTLAKQNHVLGMAITHMRDEATRLELIREGVKKALLAQEAMTAFPDYEKTEFSYGEKAKFTYGEK